MSQYKLPNETEVKVILSMLFGEDTTVSDGKDVGFESGDCSSFLGSYVNDENAPVASCVCDRALTVYAGAALSMIPAGTAEDVVASGDVSNVMVSNLGEVMNILSRTLITNNTPHLKFTKVYADKDIPDDISVATNTFPTHKGFQVSIPNYGSGQLSLRVS